MVALRNRRSRCGSGKPGKIRARASSHVPGGMPGSCGSLVRLKTHSIGWRDYDLIHDDGWFACEATDCAK